MAKVEITDIRKLRPELLDKSAAELERQITELQMALAEKQKIEEEKRREALSDEARIRREAIVDNLKWLQENGLLSEKVAGYFTINRAGKDTFAPHLSFLTRG